MCSTGHALLHPATGLLEQWSTFGCPTHTGQPWSKDKIWVAVAQGPHQSALSTAAIAHSAAEATEKVCTKQARIVAWEDIKDDSPEQLKILPIASILYKLKDFRSIVDLSFRHCLAISGVRVAVNNTTIKTAPKGAIDQIGECMSRIIHRFSKMEPTAKVFMAKLDMKGSFWWMDCEEGEEWNFAYILPQLEVEPIKLMIPTSLQMGWVESPPSFSAATETALDVTTECFQMPVSSLPTHKF
jgi:hypothetical protein